MNSTAIRRGARRPTATELGPQATPITAEAQAVDASVMHLCQRLAVLEMRVAAAVAQRRAADPDPDDRFRGLYITENQVDALLTKDEVPPIPVLDVDTGALGEQIEAEAEKTEADGADLRLRRLTRAFGLGASDVEVLLVALAPDLDPRFERLYGYLHDDVTRRRASTGLALELGGTGWTGRHSVDPGGPLVSGGLLLVEEPERPFLTRSLRVPDRVAWHLIGDDTSDPNLAPILTPVTAVDGGGAEILERALRAGVSLAYIREGPGAAGMAQAAAGVVRAGLLPVAIDLHRLRPDEDLAELAQTAAREALLVGGALVAGPVEHIVDRGVGMVQAFAEARCPVILVGKRSWDPNWSRDVPLILDAPVLGPAERASAWSAALGWASAVRARPGGGHGAIPAHPRTDRAGRPVGPAAGRGRRSGSVLPGPPGWSPRSECRRTGTAGPACRASGRLGRPGPTPAPCSGPAARSRRGPRHRDRVLDEWGMRPGGWPRARASRALRRGFRDRARRCRRRSSPATSAWTFTCGPVHGRRQVRGRDREEPGAHLRRGGRHQRGVALRRGRRHLRQAIRGEGRARPLRQRRGRLPAPADGALRRPGHPHHQPASQRRRGVHPTARRPCRFPPPRSRRPPPAVGDPPAAGAAPSRRPRSRLHGPSGSSSPAATSATSSWRLPSWLPPPTGRST